MLENLKIGPKPNRKTIEYIEQEVLFNLQKNSERPYLVREMAKDQGKEFFNFPLTARNNFNSTSPPGSFWAAASQVMSLLENGRTVYLHCTEGIHRTGMVALAVILFYEPSLENALKVLREKREECFDAVTEEDNWRANYVFESIESCGK
jgi:protein-tyrosine phosphatase